MRSYVFLPFLLVLSCSKQTQKKSLYSYDGQLVLKMTQKKEGETKRWIPRIENAKGDFVHADPIGINVASKAHWAWDKKGNIWFYIVEDKLYKVIKQQCPRGFSCTEDKIYFGFKSIWSGELPCDTTQTLCPPKILQSVATKP